ncbi:Rv2578c family radical SAM protein [Microbacterium album]|uniref:Radical SAM protein n=1 Tax=Microbacterium album TaxID=2053191 RepID=A0A917IDJ7_9MICO|nr:Rv2578c family radical SAM protein [Microbacterium album]GGH42045.1 radical SAM protein [Microbacterium album]
MRWRGQQLGETDPNALPGLEQLDGLVRSVTTPEFAGITFHEVAAKTALNHVPRSSSMPFDWTINPYRGCTHACVYCFARGTHEYLELDAGRDFDSQIVVKVNVDEVLRRELARPSWRREHVALGTNTDPYQRAEGRYRLMPGIATALAESGTPFSVLTKGSLLRRDLPLLTRLRRDVDISLAFSIAVYDDELQQAIEPGTPTAQARLDTVRAAADAGFAVSVFLMPVLPHLTDSPEALDAALARVRAAGAARAVHGALHLRPGVKPWFMRWLSRERPDLLPAYRGLYPGASVNAPAAYRTMLAQRIRPLIRAHGLDGHADGDAWRRPRATPATSARVVTTSRGRTAERAAGNEPARLF